MHVLLVAVIGADAATLLGEWLKPDKHARCDQNSSDNADEEVLVYQEMVKVVDGLQETGHGT